jgi:hypothetical protein
LRRSVIAAGGGTLSAWQALKKKYQLPARTAQFAQDRLESRQFHVGVDYVYYTPIKFRFDKGNNLSHISFELIRAGLR